MKCYNFEYINFSNGLFKNIDMSYVIHLEGNGRLKSIKNQLNKFKVTRKCCIVHNKGFKKCNKSNYINNNPILDLSHAYLTILKNAKENNYNNILIFEDDFFFDKEIENHANEINNFIISNKFHTYYLGALPGLMQSIDLKFKHYKYIFGGGAHSIIYSKNAINILLENSNIVSIKQWDVVLFEFLTEQYIYYRPLCYQLFTHTENSKYWIEGNKLLIKLTFMFIKLFKLDTRTDGYFFMYKLAKIGNYLFIYWLTLICLLNKLYKLNLRIF